MNKTGVGLIIAALALGGCDSLPLSQKELWPTKPAAPAPAPEATEPMPEAEPETAAPKPASKKVEVAPSSAPKRSPLLASGIEAYDNGKHREAAKLLRSALPKLSRPEQVEAHKYLAFIECSLNRKSQCRDEFKKALTLDPSFDLAPAEAGHPLWGPIFRSVKGSQRR